MAGNLTSAEVVAGTDISAAENNKLRDDVLVNAGDYATSTGSANAYVLAVSSDLPVYAAGQVFKFKSNFANTAAATIAVNGQAAKTIKKDHDVDLEANDIESGQMVIVMYDGTSMQMLSQKGVALTAANILLVGGGVASNADAAHMHNQHVPSFSGSNIIAAIDTVNDAYGAVPSGFSDATIDLLTILIASSSDASVGAFKIEMSNDIGSAPFMPALGDSVDVSDATPSIDGAIYIGSDLWTSDTDGNVIGKNGSDVTIVGTVRNGPLGHDNTSASLLVLYSTTKIAMFSGIAGTTITNLATDVTLDTAVTATCGFLFDDTNNEYICVDRTANLVRKFNSSGVTQSTAAYTITDTNVIGVCFISNRVYLVIAFVNDTGVNVSGGVSWFLVPTTMKRTGT